MYLNVAVFSNQTLEQKKHDFNPCEEKNTKRSISTTEAINKENCSSNVDNVKPMFV